MGSYKQRWIEYKKFPSCFSISLSLFEILCQHSPKLHNVKISILCAEIDAHCFLESPKLMGVHCSFFPSGFPLTQDHLLPWFPKWINGLKKQQRKKPQQNKNPKHPCTFVCCLCILLSHTPIPGCILFSLSFPWLVAFLDLHYQMQRLSLHMTISKVSVTVGSGILILMLMLLQH